MRTTPATGRWRRSTWSAACAASILAGTVVAAVLTVPPTANADRAGLRGETVPKPRDVRQAQSRAGDAALRVAQVRAELALANQELESAGVRAEQAAEHYNGVRWQVDQATEALRRARSDARRADRELVLQREGLARLVTMTYQGAGVPAVDAVLGADGPEGVMSRMLTYDGAITSLDAQFQEFSATATLADVFRREARQFRAVRVELLVGAEDARAVATAAAAAAQHTAAELTATKTGLVRELAELQGISTDLAQRRQSALEERLRQRAAREAAAAAATATAAGTVEQQGERRQRAAAAESGVPTPEPSRTTASPSQPTQTDPPSSPPSPISSLPSPIRSPPSPISSPPPTGGAATRAVAFAQAQLGDPYLWGAAGPDSWDCSGLTMAAWQAGGASLPHYSVAQYEATTPIAASQLRPGDLVFWGSTTNPGSIHHVALYAGDGLVVHAPRTGRPVSVDSMYYWAPPNFFSRV